MTQVSRIAIAGAGAIGARHAEALSQAKGVALAAIADRSPAGQEVAARHGVPCFPALADMIAAGGVDGVIIALPNSAHAGAALECIAAGLPALVEKPFVTDMGQGEAVIAAAALAGVPVLAGHHRRHNPLIRKALEVVRGGRLGTLTAVQAQTWFLKPDSYFALDWRTQAGAGPVLVNFIHDIDLLHALCGPVAEVQAMTSNRVRGNAVEETAVVLLRFASGLLGTVNVSDAAAAPWSWELTARENPRYPATDQNCYWIAGTQGALSLPHVTVWAHDGPAGWWSPIGATRLVHGFDDPLVLQAAHFGQVIRGEAEPVATGADGLAAVMVAQAVHAAARTGTIVRPQSGIT